MLSLLSAKGLMTPASKRCCHSTSSWCRNCDQVLPHLIVQTSSWQSIRCIFGIDKSTTQLNSRTYSPAQCFPLCFGISHQIHMDWCHQAPSKEGSRKNSDKTLSFTRIKPVWRHYAVMSIAVCTVILWVLICSSLMEKKLQASTSKGNNRVRIDHWVTQQLLIHHQGQGK